MSRRLSLRQRLLIWLLPPILLLTGLWIWSMHAIVLHFAILAYDRALEDSVLTLAGQVQLRDGQVAVNLPPAARKMLEFDQVDKVYFSVSDRRGQLQIGNHQLPPPAPAAADEAGVTLYAGDVDGEPVRIAQHRLPGDGTIFVRVAETIHKREIMAREILWRMIVPQLLFLAGIAFLIWYGVGHGIAPLRRLQQAIARRDHEDLSPLDEEGAPAEVHEQVNVINALLSRLGKTISAQRRFIADAAHQLRTPVAALRTQTELALRASDDRQRTALLRQMDAATLRLARLSNQLLNLSRAEAGFDPTRDFGPVAVAEVAEDVLATLVPAALAKSLEVGLYVSDPAPVIRADRQLLGEMLANLVDNAIRYSSEGGRVELRVDHVHGCATMRVTDNGPGIPTVEMERVLERFYRGTDATSEGSGLGLAIASEIAALHGGRIELAPSVGTSGLTVTVTMPIAR